MRMENTRTTRKIMEWKPYKTRPVGRPRLRWMDQVEEDLRRMKIIGWRVKIEDRQVWNRLSNRPGLTQGCRVNRRRKSILWEPLILNSIQNEEGTPQKWKEYITVPVYKKGDKLDCINYQWISLLSTKYKDLSSIPLSLLDPYVDTIIRDRVDFDITDQLHHTFCICHIFYKMKI